MSRLKKILVTIGALLIAAVVYYAYMAASSNIWGAKTVGDIPTPWGYERDNVGPYGQFLRDLPLKERGSQVQFFSDKHSILSTFINPILSTGVIDMPLISNDEQCADMTMRFRAEALFSRGHYSEIRFRNVSGQVLSYSGGASRKALKSYLRKAYGSYSTLSVHSETKPRKASEVQPGDVFVFTKRPYTTYGHAILVADVATNSSGQKAVLCIEGNTPARDAHIVRNVINPFRAAWFIIDDSDDSFLINVFYFKKDELRHY